MHSTCSGRVMMSFTEPGSDASPYVLLLVRALREAQVGVDFLDWKRLAVGKVHLLHVHWPETLLRRNSALGRAANRALFLALMIWAAVGRTRIVRTLHNAAPHERPSLIDRLLLALLDRVTHTWIALNETSTPPVPCTRVLYIPHGELASWYDGAVREASDGETDVLYFGLVRQYKGLPALVDAAQEMPHLAFHIAGRPTDQQLADQLRQRSAGHRNITLTLRHLPDDELVSLIRSAKLVVLPYERFENSGAAVLALNLGRPVLIPASPAARALQNEFGDRWAHMFEGQLQASHIDHALAVGVPDADAPPSPMREWPVQAKMHQDAYGMTSPHDRKR